MEKVFDVPKNVVGPENFLDPQIWYTDRNFFGDGGGRCGGGLEVAEINLFHNQFFRDWSAQSEKVGQISFRPPNFFLPVRP